MNIPNYIISQLKWQAGIFDYKGGLVKNAMIDFQKSPWWWYCTSHHAPKMIKKISHVHYIWIVLRTVALSYIPRIRLKARNILVPKPGKMLGFTHWHSRPGLRGTKRWGVQNSEERKKSDFFLTLFDAIMMQLFDTKFRIRNFFFNFLLKYISFYF